MKSLGFILLMINHGTVLSRGVIRDEFKKHHLGCNGENGWKGRSVESENPVRCYRSGPGNDDGGVDLNGGNGNGEKEKITEYIVETSQWVLERI